MHFCIRAVYCKYTQYVWCAINLSVDCIIIATQSRQQNDHTKLISLKFPCADFDRCVLYLHYIESSSYRTQRERHSFSFPFLCSCQTSLWPTCSSVALSRRKWTHFYFYSIMCIDGKMQEMMSETEDWQIERRSTRRRTDTLQGLRPQSEVAVMMLCPAASLLHRQGNWSVKKKAKEEKKITIATVEKTQSNGLS